MVQESQAFTKGDRTCLLSLVPSPHGGVLFEVSYHGINCKIPSCPDHFEDRVDALKAIDAWLLEPEKEKSWTAFRDEVLPHAIASCKGLLENWEALADDLKSYHPETWWGETPAAFAIGEEVKDQLRAYRRLLLLTNTDDSADTEKALAELRSHGAYPCDTPPSPDDRINPPTDTTNETEG